MHVAGVQPVGSRGLSGLQVVVTDRDAAKQAFEGRADAPRTAPVAAHSTSPAPVVFPREGLPLDRRPTHLRQQKAAARYREAKDLGRRPGR